MSSPTGPAATIGRLWAVARLTLTEAVRRKVFILLLLFGAAIVSSATFFPAIDATSRLRLIEVWSVRASLLFSVIVAIFLAGFSLPGDFETRRVYTLVTKPIHKMTLFGGKFLGFFLLLAVFLFAMAVISVAYIRAVSLLSTNFPPLKAEPRFPAAKLSGGRGEFYEHEGRVGVRGAEGTLMWTFRGLDPDDFGETARLHIKANLGRVGKQFALEGSVALRALNPRTGASHVVRFDEFHTNQEHPVELPRNLIADDGTLQLEMAVGEPELTIDTTRESAVLYGRSRSFELNFLKGTLLVLFQSTVVMAVTLAFSTLMTAPVSIVVGIFVYLVGMMWGHIDEGVRDIDVQMKSFREMLARGNPQQARTPEDLPPWLLVTSAFVSKMALYAIPDFSRFNFSDYLLNDHAVMGRDLAGGLLAMVVRVTVLILLGLGAMLWRDFSA